MHIKRQLEEQLEVIGVPRPQDMELQHEDEFDGRQNLEMPQDLQMQDEVEMENGLELPLNMENPEAQDFEMDQDFGASGAGVRDIQEVPAQIEVYENEVNENISRSVPDVLDSNESEPLVNPSQSTSLTYTQSASQLFNGVEVHSIPSSQRKCCVCKQETDRQTIPKAAIIGAWLDIRVFVPFKNRSCRRHIQNGSFDPASLSAIQHMACLSTVSANDFLILNEELSLLCERSRNKQKITMEDESLNDSEVKTLFGLNREQFNSLHIYIATDLRSSCNRTIRDALAIYLMKLRLNLSQEAIGILFGIQNQSRISDTISTVSNSIYEKFTPKYLGCTHLTPFQVRSHQSQFLNKIFDLSENSNIVVADGTYIYVHRSSGKHSKCIFVLKCLCTNVLMILGLFKKSLNLIICPSTFSIRVN